MIMKINMTILLSTVLVATLLASNDAAHVAGGGGSGARTSRFLAKACMIEDLSDACPDDSVVEEFLVAECEGTHGIPAAQCYMEYLCENHDQDTVYQHKECIDGVCPLAKHVPPLDCAAAAAAAAADATETTDTEAITEAPATTTTEATEEGGDEDEGEPDAEPTETEEEGEDSDGGPVTPPEDEDAETTEGEGEGEGEDSDGGPVTPPGHLGALDGEQRCEYTVNMDVHIHYPDDELAACDSQEQEIEIVTTLANAVDNHAGSQGIPIAFRYNPLTFWDPNQEVDNVNPFNRRRIRRQLQEASTCSQRQATEVCDAETADYCRWGCLQAEVAVCDEGSDEAFADLETVVTEALRAWVTENQVDCLGIVDELEVKIRTESDAPTQDEEGETVIAEATEVEVTKPPVAATSESSGSSGGGMGAGSILLIVVVVGAVAGLLFTFRGRVAVFLSGREPVPDMQPSTNLTYT